MRKLLTIIMIVTLLVGVVGCSGGGKSEVKETEKAETQKAETQKATEAQKTTAQETTKAPETEPEKVEIDKSLTGLGLLSAVPYKMPKALYMVNEIVGADGSIMTVTSYTKGMDTRTESVSDDIGKNIAIYKWDEGITYSYTEGETTGVMMVDEEEREDVDFSSFSMADAIDASGEDVVARVEMLDGNEVVYVEATEGDGSYAMTTKTWYSLEYATILKYEMYVNDELQSTTKMIEFEPNSKKVKDSLFKKPEGIEFTEFNMDTMFDGMDAMLEGAKNGEMPAEMPAELAEMMKELEGMTDKGGE